MSQWWLRVRGRIILRLQRKKAWRLAMGSPDPLMFMAMIEWMTQQPVRDQWEVHDWLMNVDPDEVERNVDDPEWVALQPVAVQRFVEFVESRPEEE